MGQGCIIRPAVVHLASERPRTPVGDWPRRLVGQPDMEAFGTDRPP